MVFDIFGLIIAFVFEEIGDGSIGLIKRHKTQSLLGFLHGAEQDGVGDPFVAIDGDFINLDLFGFMNVEKKVYCVFDFFVGNLLHIDIAAEESFVNVVFADNVFARDDHVVIHDITLGDVEFFAKVVLLALGGTLEAECAQAGAVFEADIQENEIPLYAGGGNFHILIQAGVPQILDGLGNLVAGNVNHISDMERQDSLVKRRGSRGGNAADFVSFGRRIVNFDRLVGLATPHHDLRTGSSGAETEYQHQDYISYQTHPSQKKSAKIVKISMCPNLFASFSETAFTMGELLDDFLQVFPAEFRPHHGREKQLCISQLPQQEVADALITGSADHQVHIRNFRMVEVLADGVLVNILGVEFAFSGLTGDLFGGISKFGSSAVADGHVHCGARAMR